MITSKEIRAVQIWMRRAFSLSPTKVLTFRFCFQRLEEEFLEIRSIGFQLTPPHGGRRPQTPCVFHRAVSTHAPAWGAQPPGGDVGRHPVSTHAPAWGGDREHVDTVALIDVSTHAPAWGRLFMRRIQYLFDVSTHAPAWGATATYLRQ